MLVRRKPLVVEPEPLPEEFKLVEDTSIVEEEEYDDTQPLENILPEIYDFSTCDPDKLPPYVIYEPIAYRDGPEGFIKWCEDKVFIPIYPEGSDIPVWTAIKDLNSDIHPRSGKSYNYIWEMQKEEVRKALRQVAGRFIYKLIILSWMRGEGKSLLACLIQCWKFMNWPKQNIVLGANSKEQTKFVHYDVIRDIILNSPQLLETVGERNIQEKEIRLRDEAGNVSSVLRAISSFSGIVSNITGYTFSEMFDMKNPKFFTQLDGSIRNIPNALGVIDSTVSAKTHVLYKMYQAFITRATKSLFFSYRCSPKAQVEDYWNPNMDQQQLDDYKAKFPLGDFEMYFMNVWGSNAQQVFTQEMIEATNIIGVNGKVAPMSSIMEVIKRKVELTTTIEEMTRKNIPSTFNDELTEINQLNDKLYSIENIYKLRDQFGMPRQATLSDVDALSDLYDTNWALLVGLDRADPLKKDRTAARTIVEVTLKGLPGSRSNPHLADNGNPQYMYISVNTAHVADSLLEGIKDVILEAHETLDGVDAICGERWGIWDMALWCEEQGIRFEPIHPSYDKQKAAFSELHGAISTGRYKTPPLVVWGSKGSDIFKEEATVFFHDDEKHWFGSPEKMEKYGVQDDCMFAKGWAVYGGRDLKVDDFKERNRELYFGTFVRNRDRLIKD
jgi:hypothetical protein